MVVSGFNVTIDEGKLVRALQRAPGRLAEELRRAFVNIGADFVSQHSRRQFGPYKGSAYADKLQARSGRTRRHTRFTVRGSFLDDMTLTIWNDAGPGNVAQEHGGTFRAKRAQSMSVPTKAALTPSGNLKGAMMIAPQGNFTAGGKRTFILNTKDGRSYIAIRDERGRTIAIRRLLKSVTLPGSSNGGVGRFGLERTWNDAGMRSTRATFIEEAVGRTLRAIGEDAG